MSSNVALFCYAWIPVVTGEKKLIIEFVFLLVVVILVTLMAEEGEKKESESKKHTYPLVRVSS